MHLLAYFTTLILAALPVAMADFANFSCCQVQGNTVTSKSGYTQSCCNVGHGEYYDPLGMVRKSIALIILS